MFSPEMMKLAEEQTNKLTPEQRAAGEAAMNRLSPEAQQMLIQRMSRMTPEEILKAQQNLMNITPEEMLEKLATVSQKEEELAQAAEVTFRQADDAKKAGNQHAGQEEFKEAIKKYNEALVILKDVVTIPDSKFEELRKSCLLNLAHCLLEDEQPQQAAEVCTFFLKTYGEHFKALYRRGRAFRELGRLKLAKADLSRAMNLQPNDASITSFMAEVDKEITDKGETVDDVAELEKKMDSISIEQRQKNLENLKNFNFVFAWPEIAAFDGAKKEYKDNINEATRENVMKILRNRCCAFMMKANLFNQAAPFCIAAKEENTCPPEKWSRFTEAKAFFDVEMSNIKREAEGLATGWSEQIFNECNQILLRSQGPPPPAPDHVTNFNFEFKFPEKAEFDAAFKAYAKSSSPALKQHVEGVLRKRCQALMMKGALFSQAAQYITYARNTGKPVDAKRWERFLEAKRELDGEDKEIKQKADELKPGWGTSQDIFKEMAEVMKKQNADQKGPVELPPAPKQIVEFNFKFDFPEEKEYLEAKLAVAMDRKNASLKEKCKHVLLKRTTALIQKSQMFQQCAPYILAAKQANQPVTEERWADFLDSKTKLDMEVLKLKEAAEDVQPGWALNDQIFKDAMANHVQQLERAVAEGKLKLPPGAKIAANGTIMIPKPAGGVNTDGKAPSPKAASS